MCSPINWVCMNQTHQSTFTYYVHLSFYFLFNMIIVLYNALLNIFACKRRLTNFLLLSLIIIIITCKRSQQSTTVIDIRGIISSSTAGQLSRLTKQNCQTRGVFLRIFCYQGGRRRFFRENASAWKRLHLIRLRMEAKSF